MSISYEEALSTLQAMFGEPWTRESLDAVLRHYQGHMENTVEAVLSHGDKPPQQLIDKLKSGGGNAAADTTALDEQLARALSQGQNVSRSSRSSSSSSSPVTTSGSQKKGRGTPTTLPDDFLRIPNRTYEATASAGATNSDLEADEKLARMLQDELFSEELARNPDFAHLAGRRPRDSQTANPNATRSNVWTGPGFPARNGQGQPQPLPNIMEKLSEMGNTAKHRLALMAAQFKANNNRNAGGVGGGDAYNSAGSPGREMRGLLDGDDYDTMELASRKDL